MRRIRWAGIAEGGGYRAVVNTINMLALPCLGGGWEVFGMGGRVRVQHKYREVAGRAVVAAVSSARKLK